MDCWILAGSAATQFALALLSKWYADSRQNRLSSTQNYEMLSRALKSPLLSWPVWMQTLSVFPKRVAKSLLDLQLRNSRWLYCPNDMLIWDKNRLSSTQRLWNANSYLVFVITELTNMSANTICVFFEGLLIALRSAFINLELFCHYYVFLRISKYHELFVGKINFLCLLIYIDIRNIIEQ